MAAKKTIRLINNSKGTYVHNDIILQPGAIKEVDEKLANIWTKIEGVQEYVDPQEVKAEIEALIAEIERLKAENTKLTELLDQKAKD